MNNNKNMNPIFSLKNFRSFGEDGADFELAPITVLTGCNSAGKSSLVKALMLLSPRVEGVSYSENLQISSKDLCLGGYKNVAHRDGKIVMSYKIWSTFLQETIVVTRKYCAKRNDELNDGALYHFTVEKIDGTVIYQMGPGWVNGYLDQDVPHDDVIREEFNRFYAVGCFMYYKETLLPIVERREEKQKENNSSKVKRSKSVLEIVKERLRAVGLSETEAALLWKEFDHKSWHAVLRALDEAFGLGTGLQAKLVDLEKKPDEAELEVMMRKFIDLVVEEACSPFFTQQPVYINSSSAQIERLYTIGNENKMCNALRELNRRKIQYHNDFEAIAFGPYSIHKPGSFLDKWLDKFELGKGLKVRGTDQGLGLMAFLNNGKEERLLADEGYGITQLVALLLQIDNCIPIRVDWDEETYSREHEYVYYYKPKTICVEEPEVHLHPKYQSLLAEMFVEAYQKYNIHFIIETHSEYLIRKLQVMIADKKHALSPNDVSLNYVEKDENGVSTNRKIEIMEDGRLGSSFGDGFFDEAGSLSRKLFTLNK